MATAIFFHERAQQLVEESKALCAERHSLMQVHDIRLSELHKTRDEMRELIKVWRQFNREASLNANGAGVLSMTASPFN